MSFVVILLAILLGGLAMMVVIFVWMQSRRESKQKMVEELADELVKDPKLRSAGVAVDIVHSIRSGDPPVVEEPHTRIRVLHHGTMPCVVVAKQAGLFDRGSHQFGTLSIRFINVATFEATKKQGVHDLDLPKKVYMGNKKVSTAIEKDMLPRCIELAESIFDAETQGAIAKEAFTAITVEPNVVSLIRQGYVLDENALRQMADFLLLLSDKVQKATVS